jgi:hypothetical protein
MKPEMTPAELRAQPPFWEQYRKAVVAAGVGLLAMLTDLGTSYASGDRINGGEWIHAAIVLVSTILTTAGVAAISNVYPAAVLRQRLEDDANARLRGVLADDPPGRHEIGGTGRSDGRGGER